MAITAINGNAFELKEVVNGELIITDPPFEMSGRELAGCFSQFEASHLVLICSMRQAIEFSASQADWHFGFDFVLDLVSPRQSKSQRQPNYIHANGLYFTKGKTKSAFNRKKRNRSDLFVFNGYWPTVIKAPRENVGEHGMAKNQQAWTDILGAFDVSSVIDPFMGLGTTLLSAYELDIEAAGIELDSKNFKTSLAFMKMLGLRPEVKKWL